MIVVLDYMMTKVKKTVKKNNDDEGFDDNSGDEYSNKI